MTPILFMQFSVLLFKLFTKKIKKRETLIGEYIDDGLLTMRYKSIKINVSKIALVFQKFEQSSYGNGMVFNPAKFEAIHFPQKRNFSNLDT